MKIVSLLEERDDNLNDWANEAYYSGERIILRGNDGVLAAIVPIEDLEVLSEIEGEKVQRLRKVRGYDGMVCCQSSRS